MDLSGSAPRRAHRLLQFGILLFLISLLVGIAVPQFTVPRLALSTHLLGIMQGVFLMVLGLLWPRLRLSATAGRAVLVMVTYGCFGAWAANLLGAIWGAGNSIVPIAAGQARGTGAQELIINVMLRSAAVALIASVSMVGWGLRTPPAPVASRSGEVV